MGRLNKKNVINSFILILASSSIANNLLDGFLSDFGIWHILAIAISITVYQNIHRNSTFSSLSTAIGVFIGLRFTAITSIEGWPFENQNGVLDSIDAGWITYTSAPVAGILVFLLIQMYFSHLEISDECE